MKGEIGSYKVGVAYTRYGYIQVSTKDIEEAGGAVEAAQKKLDEMSVTDLDAITEYLEDSAEIDEEAVFPVHNN